MGVADLYFNLGNVAKNQGAYDEANGYYQKVLRIQVSKFGEDHEDVASTYLNLATVAGQQSNREEAKAYLKKALNVFVNKLGEDHENVATCSFSLGAVAMGQGEYEEARAHNEKALQIYERTNPGDDPTVKQVRCSLAHCFKSIAEKAAADGEAAAAAQAFDKAIEHGVLGFDGGFRDWIASIRADLGV